MRGSPRRPQPPSTAIPAPLSTLQLPPPLVFSALQPPEFLTSWRLKHWERVGEGGVSARYDKWETRLVLPGAVLLLPRKGRPYFTSPNALYDLRPSELSWEDHKVIKYIRGILYV